MKRIKHALLALVLAISAFIPVANVSAAGSNITSVEYSYQGSPSHLYVYGETEAGVYAVVIEVYNEDATELLDSVTDNTSVESGKTVFGEDLNLITDTTKVYTIRVADYNGGVYKEIKTRKPITSFNIKVAAPTVGETVTVNEDDGPDILPIVSTEDEGYALDATYVKGDCLDGSTLCYDFFEGTFEEGEYYYVDIWILADEDHEIALSALSNTLINGSAPVEVFTVYLGSYTHFIAKVQATVENTETESDVKAADTGVAPKPSDSTDKAIKNISLGVSIVVASAILYGAHLYISHKKNA